LSNKLSDKDKKDWEDFISNNNKIPNKDFKKNKDKNNQGIVKKIDLHGFSLENANKTIEDFITKCFNNNVNKIIVITGKGLRSKNISNPYVSRDLSILKYSVPEFINSQLNLMKIIKKIKKADIEHGGEGAFYIYLKNFKE
jgi:DNA-nicking Smr family endonuclease|tara:strand:+ start:314 stop:736 length:423 start_codon:yes stop_codon:yes gene_type:complete